MASVTWSQHVACRFKRLWWGLLGPWKGTMFLFQRSSLQGLKSNTCVYTYIIRIVYIHIHIYIYIYICIYILYIHMCSFETCVIPLPQLTVNLRLQAKWRCFAWGAGSNAGSRVYLSVSNLFKCKCVNCVCVYIHKTLTPPLTNPPPLENNLGIRPD